MNAPRIMTLQAALGLLARIHTRDDDLTGFTVQMGARPEPWEHAAYIEAWEVVRTILVSPGEHVVKPEPLDPPKIRGFEQDMPGINDDPMAAERFIKLHGGGK